MRMKKEKPRKAPKVPNRHPEKPYMKEAGVGMKKSQALPMKQKRLSK
jgi:hypothetical protein